MSNVKRFDASQGPRIVGPRDGKSVELGAIGARFIVWGEESGGGFSLVEHPIPPRTLAAPVHRHAKEDEYSYVLEGRLGALLGDDVVYAEAGDLAFKPRGQWHTFWNAGDTVCRILEIISPAGSSTTSTTSRRPRSRGRNSARATASRSTSTASPSCAKSTVCASPVLPTVAARTIEDRTWRSR